jgi:conjugal transfer mating pair stabilization protein TraN
MLRQYLIAALLAGMTPALCAQGTPPAEPDDHMESAGKEGSTLARDLRAAGQGRMPSVDDDGTVRLHDGEAIRPGGLSPGSQRESTQALEDLGDASVEELNHAGAEAMRRMERDSRSVGHAYRGVVNQEREETTALQADGALWEQSDGILDELGREENQGRQQKNALADTYASCTSETRYRDIAAGVRSEGHIYTCERLNIRPDSSRRRDITVADEAFDGGGFGSDTLTRDAVVDVALNVPPNAQGVTWDVETSGTVRRIELTTPPTPDSGWVGVFTITYENRPCDGLPPDAACAGRPQSAHVRFFGRYQLYEEELTCDPENCLLERDAFCRANWTCTASEPQLINGVLVDESYLPQMAPLFPEQEGLCFAAEAEYECNYMLGQLCWTKPNGEQECVENTEDTVTMNTCDRVDQQQGTCGIVGQRCTEDSIGHDDFCHVTSVTYNCSTPVPVSNLDMEIDNNCSGAVRCMGDECLNDRDTAIQESGDTGRTMARLLLHDHVLSDWEIAEQAKDTGPKATTQPVEHFAGAAFECRKALGGTVDCCTEEAPGGQALWFDLYPKVTRQANAVVSEQLFAGQGEGSWKTLADRVYTNEALNLSITTPLETVRGGRHGQGEGPWMLAAKADGTAPASNVRAASMAEIKPLFIAQAREHTQDPGWACTQQEYDLAVQRDAGMCTKVGQRCAAGALGACLDKRDVYCCFSSPLSRQVRETMAVGVDDPFGSAKEPICGGVSIVELERFDWETVPLEDMVARMEQAGVLPTKERLAGLSNVEKIDGQLSAVVREDEIRVNTIERNRARLNEINVVEAAVEIEKVQRLNVPVGIADPDVVGEVTLAQGFTSAFAGTRVPMQLLRTGSVGSVSVGWRTRDGTALAGRDYIAASGRVSWAGGMANQPQLIHIETLVQPRGNHPPRELTIELFDPQGGSVLGDVPVGLVRRSRAQIQPPIEGPVRRPPSLALSKEYIGTTEYYNAHMLAWRITATNTSDYTITGLQLLDIPTLPPGIEQDYTRSAFGHAHQGAESCTLGVIYPGAGGLNLDQLYAECNLRHGTLLQPNESITWILFTAFDYGMLVNNQCGAWGQFAIDGNQDGRWDWYYWPVGSVASCQASVQAPSAPTTLEQACAAASAFSQQLGDSSPYFEVALDGFPEIRPGEGDSNVNGYYAGVWPFGSFSEMFEIDSATPVSLRMRLGFERIAGTFASGVTLTISPCKDDLRPTNDTNDGTTGSACRYVGPPFAAPGQPLPGLNVAFGAGADPSECVLEPGERYFLNYAFYDLRQPIVPGQDLCEAEYEGEGPCELRFEWHERP